MTIDINGAKFTLLPQKALYKPDEQLLIIADVHLGKASHFRKEGISIPADAQMSDYDNLANLFSEVKPSKVYFLGDLFHSTFNRDWHYFCDLIAQFPQIAFVLVRGNHDLIDKKRFSELCIEVADTLEDDRFIYSHAPLDNMPAGKMNIYGHIHPGITLSGMARQHVTLPCFYITGNEMVLPAFGILTGLYRMELTRQAQIYVVAPGGVKKL